MANNSRGLCPRCGGAGAECCGGQVNEEAWAANRKRITELEAALAERDRRVVELEANVIADVNGSPFTIEVHSPVFDDAAPWRNQYQEREPEMFHQYRRKQIAELRPYVSGEDMTGISVSDADKAAGSPKQGDMIARNPKNHDDKWLVAAQYFADNFESVA